MSKRGRRRSSRRRKSSSSSKQSTSPYIFQQQNQSNSISYRDDVVEKGETDSLGKENVLSGHDDQEAYSNDPPREKRYKQDYEVTSFKGDKSVFTKTTEVEERGMKIVTSVSVSEMENCPTKVLCQQSYEPFSENPTDSSAPVTNIFKVNCSGLQVKLEIQEAVQLKTYDMETTLVFRNENRSAEMNIKRKCERTWTPDNDSPEQPSLHVSSHRGNQSTNYTFHFGTVSEQTAAQCDARPVCSGNMWGDPNYCQCCNDRSHRASADLMLTNEPSNLPFLLNSVPPAKRADSFNGDQFWDIPPPQEFADIKYNTLEDLTQDLASFRIGARSPANRQRRAYSAEPRSPFSLQVEEIEDLAPSLDRLSELDNFEPMFMRPSLSTNRSSFTKDFIYCQRRKSWIRNNSIATVEHRVCSLLKKRRQTFPGTSHGPGLTQDDLQLPYNESFSSLIMCSLPFQTERLGRVKQRSDSFSAFGHYMSSKSPESVKPASEIPDGRRGKLLSPFYTSSSNDNPDSTFTERRRSSSRTPEPDAKQTPCKDMESLDIDDCDDKINQNEVVDVILDQDLMEIECYSPEVLEVSQRGLAIQVIPPSCSGSEEQILQSQTFVPIHINPNQTDSARASPELSESRQSHRFLQVDSTPAGTGVEQDLQTALENLCMSPVEDPDVGPSNTETSEPNLAENTVPSSPLQPMHKERDLHVVAGGAESEDFKRPADVTSRPEKHPMDDTNELLGKADKADKQVVYRSSIETKEHLKPVFHKDRDSSVSDHWAKRRKLFKESKQWSSAGGSSLTSDITEESVSEDTYSTDMVVPDIEDRGFYTETFHSSAWIYQGDEVCPGAIRPALTTRTRPVSIRERTVKISKGTGEYPWGFRIQFSKPIVVTEVDTNGAAEEAGLMVGDYVLAVNGIDVTSIPHSEAANLARQGPDVLTLTIGSDIARGPNTPRPPCRGYLHKRTQSGLIKGWRKRWFVLTHDCCLYYYKHKRDEGKRRAVSSVKLEGAEVGPDSSLGKPFVFKCRPQSGNRVYFFCATSNQEMKRWLEALEKAIHPITQNHVWVDVTRHNSNLPPLAVKSPDCLGLLHKMDKTKDMWVQHYCILKDGCLYLYSGIRATHAHGGIYLQGYTVREQPYGSKKSTIELRPPSDEFKTFYLCAENPAENKRWMVAIKASIKKWLPLHQALQDYMNRPPEETRM